MASQLSHGRVERLQKPLCILVLTFYQIFWPDHIDAGTCAIVAVREFPVYDRNCIGAVSTRTYSNEMITHSYSLV